MNFQCIFDPGYCFEMALNAVSWTWLFVGLVAGSVVGAVFGWLGVASMISSFIAGFFAGRRDHEPEDWKHPDKKTKSRR